MTERPWTEYWKAFFGFLPDHDIYMTELSRKFPNVDNEQICRAIDFISGENVARPTLKTLIKAMYSYRKSKGQKVKGEILCQPCRDTGWVCYVPPKHPYGKYYSCVIPCVCDKGRDAAAARWPKLAERQLQVAKQAVSDFWRGRKSQPSEPEETAELVEILPY